MWHVAAIIKCEASAAVSASDGALRFELGPLHIAILAKDFPLLSKVLNRCKPPQCNVPGRICTNDDTSDGDDGPNMLLVPTDARERSDATGWRMAGMRSTRSGRYNFSGLTLSADSRIGQKGDYLCEPHFEGGIWRYCAAHLGGAEPARPEIVQARVLERRPQRGGRGLLRLRIGAPRDGRQVLATDRQLLRVDRHGVPLAAVAEDAAGAPG